MRISSPHLSPAEALAKARANARANAQSRDEARREALDHEAAEESAPKTSPAEIDARRAQQLLERATALSERGDMSAAILATRQSLALAPESVAGHLLHARLLERNRDFAGARDAYARGARLAPDRADARDNFARLDAYLKQAQGAARQFNFDAEELFAPDRDSENAPVLGETIIAPAVAAQAVVLPVDSMDMFDESMLPSIEVRLPPTRGARPEGAGGVEGVSAQSAFMAQSDKDASEQDASKAAQSAPPVPDRRKHNVPVATERRRSGTSVSALGAASSVAALASSAAIAAAPRERVETPREGSLAAALAPAIASGSLATPATSTARASDAIFDDSFDPTSVSAANMAPARANLPLDLDLPAAPSVPLWQQVVARPSFYARALPLVGVALLSLGFLSWARGRAISQLVAPTQLAASNAPLAPDSALPTEESTDSSALDGAPAPNVGALATANAPAPANGFPISNAPFTFQAPPATTANVNDNSGGDNSANGSNANASNRAPATAPASGGAPQTTARASNRASGGTNNRPRFVRRALPPARPVPRFPSVSLAPAPIPPASVRSTIPRASAPIGGGGGNIILPRPSIDMPAPSAPRQRVLPPTNNALNPAGSPDRGYVRVTEGRVGNGVIPARPSAVARENERAANDSARNGQDNQAISQLSQAIRADSDNAGFRYQQRATLFLQRSDYNRAIDDFQSAISSYQSQISGGNDVAQAKRGLSSSRSGLNLALAGKRGGG